jgi:hypothetical protein
VEEVRGEAESGAPPLAAVDAVAKRRVRALAATNVTKFFAVAAASTSACCAAVGAAKFLLRAVAAPLRIGPLRAGPPVMAVTGLMPTAVYGALLAGYFLFHGAQGAMERARGEQRRGRPSANDVLLQRARGRLRNTTQGDHPQQKPAAAIAARRASISGGSYTGGSFTGGLRPQRSVSDASALDALRGVDSPCGSPTSAAVAAAGARGAAAAGSGACRITLKAGGVSRRSLTGAGADDELAGGPVRRASTASDAGATPRGFGDRDALSPGAAAAAGAVLGQGELLEWGAAAAAPAHASAQA